MEAEYNHKNIEAKWQAEWENQGLYKIADMVEGKQNYLTLVEFTYPSGNLHVGHWYAFTVPDIFARYKRMQGFNSLYPMGFDAFGLPAENAAIKLGEDPKTWTYEHMNKMRTQLCSMGTMFDWSREVVSCNPDYYKWTQMMFAKFFENDLAYRSNTKVNWCPNDMTILANEQVIDGKCDRCGSVVEQKNQEQWMLRITKYADRLIGDLENLNWPDSIKEAQKNWIGRSEGSEIGFQLVSDLPPTPSQGRGEAPGYITTDSRLYNELYEKALEMRSNPTQAEEALWKELKSNKQGVHFRRQHIIQNFIVDFLCLSKNLIIEVDGDIHDLQKERDEERTKILESLGYTIIRFTNNEVIENVDNAVRNILEKIKELGDAKVLPLGEDLGEVSLADVKIFTTRADTLFGVTYAVLAPEHSLVQDLKEKISNWTEVEKYIFDTKNKSELDRQQNKEKTGVCLKGIFAVNPANNERVPVWVADYVLAGYGTGAVMAVPAHDERDFEFATKYNLPIKEVIEKPKYFPDSKPYTEYGIVKDSISWMDGLLSQDAKKEIVEELEGRGLAKEVKTYRLRDWGISRQRYWGVPIPIVYDPQGTAHAISAEHLPWLLPTDVDHKPDGTAPLARSKELFERTEKIFGKGWTPEVETMDTFVDSSWYFYRYLDPKNENEFCSKKKMKAWLPINLYMGGAEHTTMHLLYSRFWTKALHDLGMVNNTEEFTIRRNRGLILGPDGEKMSKSKGNVIDPDEIVERLGADTVRMYLAFMGPYGVTTNYPWDPNGVVGIRRFLERVWRFVAKNVSGKNNIDEPVWLSPAGRPEDPRKDSFLPETFNSRSIHKTIKKVTEDIENFKFNTAVSALMICLNDFEKSENISIEDIKVFLQLLAPFAPHMTEELWHTLGESKSVHLSTWPKYDESKIIDESFTVVVQINGKVRDEFIVGIDVGEEEVKNMALVREKVKKWLGGAEPKKIIYIKNKLVSIVV